MRINVEVDDSNFYDFIDNFRNMVSVFSNTLSNFAPILGDNISPYVPYRIGALEDSFNWRIVSGGDFVELNFYYSVVTKAGFDYAFIQHEKDFYHPIKGTSKYVVHGIHDSVSGFFTMLETDFLSLFGGVF